MKEPMIRLDGKNNSVYIYGIKVTSIEDWVDVKEKIARVQTENTNLKQALNEIKEYINSNPLVVTDENDIYALNLLENENDKYNFITHILQIIDKYMKEDD